MVVAGHCDKRFEPVREAFRLNFAERGDTGGAVAISIGGRRVVDLWGGHRDLAGREDWREDTIVNFFSVSKALATLVVLRLVQAGRLLLDRPVTNYWPEFGAEGKETVTLRTILSHRAGLPAIREVLPEGAMIDRHLMSEKLAGTRPWWPPGSAHGYHVNTFGFLLGAIVERVSGQSLGALLRAEIAVPLKADVHIGLAAHDHDRCAEFRWPEMPIPELPAGADEMLEMRSKTYRNPPGLSGFKWVNRWEWRRAEIPSTNGHGSARGIDRVCSVLAAGGQAEGFELLAPETLNEALKVHSDGPDLVLERDSRFGLGFQLPRPERGFGPNPKAFGHYGAGGSLGFCDPEARLSFGYVTNDMGPRWQNPRNKALIEAIYESLCASPSG